MNKHTGGTDLPTERPDGTRGDLKAQGSNPTSTEGLRQAIANNLGCYYREGTKSYVREVFDIDHKFIRLENFDDEINTIVRLFDRYASRVAKAELEKLEALPNIYPEKINGEYTHVEAIYKSAISNRIAALDKGEHHE